MPVPLMAIGKGASLLAPFVASMFSGGGKIDWAKMERWLATVHPDGYLTDADRSAGEATKSRLMTTANDTEAGLRTEALRRARQRGTETAPALETTLARIGQTGARARQHAGDAAEEQLYNVGLGNKRFEQSKALDLVHSRLGDATAGRNRAGLQQSTLVNSLLDITPTILGHIDRIPGVAGSNRRRFNPATGGFEDVPLGKSRDMIDSGADDYDSENYG